MNKLWKTPSFFELEVLNTFGGSGSSYAESADGTFLGDLQDFQNGIADPNTLPYIRDNFDRFRFRSTTVS